MPHEENRIDDEDADNLKSLYRDAAYLRWRYLEDPYREHFPFGVFTADDTLRGIGALTLSPTDTLPSLVTRA